ncbi:MAG: hypothetical protein AAFX05_07015 [Planctomycetota bacterium]
MTRSACAIAGVLFATGSAFANVTDVNAFRDVPRLFNDRPGSNLTYSSNFGAGTVSVEEDTYGGGGFANRHVSWFSSDGGATARDFNYGDFFDICTTLTIDATDAEVEAGFSFDLFGLGAYRVRSSDGEIASFGSAVNQFHSFGTGLYAPGETLSLRMIYRPGSGDGFTFNPTIPSTVEYLYNNLSQATGWVSSGKIQFTNGEGGIPDGVGNIFQALVGVGAQINNPDPTTGSVNVQFTDIKVLPAPGTAALLGLAGLVGVRRRR